MSKPWRDAWQAAVYAMLVGSAAVAVGVHLPAPTPVKVAVAAGVAVVAGMVFDPLLDIARAMWAGWRSGKTGRR